MSINKYSKIHLGSNKSFGILFAFIFLLISLFPLIEERHIRVWSLVISIMLFIVSFVSPALLSPFNKAWFKFGLFLGNIISPLAMGVFFFLFITPTGLLIRLVNKNYINKKIDKSQPSYWIERKEKMGSMKNQF